MEIGGDSSGVWRSTGEGRKIARSIIIIDFPSSILIPFHIRNSPKSREFFGKIEVHAIQDPMWNPS